MQQGGVMENGEFCLLDAFCIQPCTQPKEELLASCLWATPLSYKARESIQTLREMLTIP